MAQTGQFSGTVLTPSGNALTEAEVILAPSQKNTVTDKQGHFQFDSLEYGLYQVMIYKPGYEIIREEFTMNEPQHNSKFEAVELAVNLGEFVLTEEQSAFGVDRLKSVDGVAIYAAKKNEVVLLDQLAANKSVNNARQVFAKVPGLNIWESDAGGLQLGIGARGLSPNRTSNFNTRQNGYDISADALGYPESYYTPPVEAIERIEVVRGAASLQYGTQFGGMLNFVFKAPPKDKTFQFDTRQTIGSYGLFNSFNRIGGTIKKFFYTGFYQYKRGDGWRPNSGFENHMGYINMGYKFSKKLTLRAEYTHMNYLAQQPGGLTDKMFEEDPQQSVRERNWFKVNWNLAALILDYRISKRTKLNSRTFGVFSSREALGNLDRINVADFGENRTLISGTYNNVGNETRILHQYNFLGNPANFLTGVRLYQGTTTAKQGEADNGSDADFTFLNPDDVEDSDFTFPNTNLAWFAENVFRPSQRWSITPGVRAEYIKTNADGWYKQRTTNFAGEVISEETIYEDRTLERSFVLFGLGVSYRAFKFMEVYGNISQNYRSVTFSDIRIDNPNLIVDPDIKDENGYNADLGIRGGVAQVFTYDMSFFYLAYNDKISILNVANQPPLYLDQRYRTNVGRSRTYGLELFAEVDVWKIFFGKEAKNGLSAFTNLALTDAKYVETEDTSIEGNDVELVPPVNLKAGLTFKRGDLKISYQYAFVDEQYTDATNAEFVSTAVSGLIPAYSVQDISASYKYKRYSIEAGVNNLTDERYFTRRAVSYPGPGIIPAEARSFYLTLGVKI